MSKDARNSFEREVDNTDRSTGGGNSVGQGIGEASLGDIGLGGTATATSSSGDTTFNFGGYGALPTVSKSGTTFDQSVDWPKVTGLAALGAIGVGLTYALAKKYGAV